MRPSPPPLPLDTTYTKAYCEENVYLLVKHIVKFEPAWRVSAVFISNASKTVALWDQKASQDPTTGFVVAWDYHVVLALTLNDGGTPNGENSGELSWIYDMDSRLSMPCPAGEYLIRTFLDQDSLEERWRSAFRVVPGQLFLDNFASDRSHMLQAPGGTVYHAEPPAYGAIVGPEARKRGVDNNLMSDFVCMEVESFGVVARSVRELLSRL